jgi:hypothetical protein
MLGTFLGMVVTFKGAVFALEGSTDLQAIRSALAAPIRGLGLSFGTSVAGVAASAMLGLMSAVARRERADVARQLDQRIATVFLPFSLVHQRQETFRALQEQARAMPALVGATGSHGAAHRSARPSARRAIAGPPGRVPPRSGDGVRHPRPRRRRVAAGQPGQRRPGGRRQHPPRGRVRHAAHRAGHRATARPPGRRGGDAGDVPGRPRSNSAAWHCSPPSTTSSRARRPTRPRPNSSACRRGRSRCRRWRPNSIRNGAAWASR